MENIKIIINTCAAILNIRINIIEGFSVSLSNVLIYIAIATILIRIFRGVFD